MSLEGFLRDNYVFLRDNYVFLRDNYVLLRTYFYVDVREPRGRVSILPRGRHAGRPEGAGLVVGAQIPGSDREWDLGIVVVRPYG